MKSMPGAKPRTEVACGSARIPREMVSAIIRRETCLFGGGVAGQWWSRNSEDGETGRMEEEEEEEEEGDNDDVPPTHGSVFDYAVLFVLKLAALAEGTDERVFLVALDIGW